MPNIEAIYYTGNPVISTESKTNPTYGSTWTASLINFKSAYIAISGITVGQFYSTVVSNGGYVVGQGSGNGVLSFYNYPVTPITVGYGLSNSDFIVLPCDASLNGDAKYYDTGGITENYKVRASGLNFTTAITLALYNNPPELNCGLWTISQDNYKNIVCSCTSFGSDFKNKTFFSYSNNQSNGMQAIPEIWKISLQDTSGNEIASKMVKPSVTTAYPTAVLNGSSITVSQLYKIQISRRIVDASNSYFVFNDYDTVLTAPAVTSGGGNNTNMFSWLNNDYWYLTDLQVNLGTRSVAHRHGTVQIKPNDTVNFAILFHDGSFGVDPEATDLRLAVRSANNASAYYFWANPSVTTTSVSGDVYYNITVTASDEDLLAAQALNLTNGSSGSQNLIAEVQWTTTRGTFSSDTFTIEVPSEVIREPDV